MHSMARALGYSPVKDPTVCVHNTKAQLEHAAVCGVERSREQVQHSVTSVPFAICIRSCSMMTQAHTTHMLIYISPHYKYIFFPQPAPTEGQLPSMNILLAQKVVFFPIQNDQYTKPGM